MNLWLLLGIAVIVTAIHLPRIEDGQSSRLRDDSEDSLHRTPSPMTLSDLLHPRFYRNVGDDNLKTTVSNLKMVARITNGVYLLQELIAGRIPSDVLISEMLQFGSVTPTQISAINASQIDGAVASLKALTGNLTPDGKAARAEDSFGSLKAVRDSIGGIGNISDWKGRKHFEDEMKRLSKFGKEMRSLNKLQTEISNWVNTLADFNDQGSNATAAQFVKLKDALVIIKNSHMNPEPFKPTFKFNGFSTAMDGISSVTKATNGVNLYKSKFNAIQLLDDEATAYTSFMQSMFNQMSNLYDHAADLDTIVALLKTRSGNINRIRRNHTFGLVNGPSDFSSIPRDMNDPWIRKVVRVDSLKEAFESLKDLIGLVENMDGALGRRKDDVAATVRLQSYFAMVKTISAGITDGTPGVNKINVCGLPSALNVPKNSFDNFTTLLQSIDDKLLGLEKGIEELSKLFSDSGIVTTLDEVMKLCDDASKSSDLDQYKQTFLNNDHVKSLDPHIVAIGKQTRNIQSEPDMVASTVLKNISALDEYLKKMDHYAGYFKCLQDNSTLKSVFGAIDGIQKIRGWKDDNVFAGALDNGMTVVKMVVGTAPGLAKLKTSIGSLKGRKVPEFKGLEDLKNASIHSQTIGLAVQGISSMSMALERRKDVMIEDSDLDVVKDNKGKAETGDVANLDALIKMAPSIAPMFTALSTFNGSVSVFVSSSSFANQSGIFESAESVTGVSGNFSTVGESVGNLKKMLPRGPEADQLDNVEKALKAMDSMDLDFARYQKSFNASKGSLAAMDAFLLSYAKKQTPTVKAPSPVQSYRQGNQTYQVQVITKQPEESSLMETVKLVAIIVAAVLLLAVFITPLIWFLAFRKSFKKRFFFFWRKKDPYVLLKILVNDFMEKLRISLNRKITLEAYSEADGKEICEMFKTDYGAATVFLRESMDSDEKEVGHVTFIKTECRYEVRISKRVLVSLSGYGVRFKNNKIAAARVKLATKQLMILTQCPQLKSDDREDTVVKFWWMVRQTKSKTVVMLCPTGAEKVEDPFDIYFPQEKGKKMQIGDLTLVCLEVKTEEDLETRSITAQFGTKKPVTVTHYWKKKWSWVDNDASGSMVQMLKAVLKSKAPFVVHCATGIKLAPLFAITARSCASLIHNNNVDCGADFQEVSRVMLEWNWESEWNGTPGGQASLRYAFSLLIKYFSQDFDFDKRQDKELQDGVELLTKIFVDDVKLCIGNVDKQQ